MHLPVLMISSTRRSCWSKVEAKFSQLSPGTVVIINLFFQAWNSSRVWTFRPTTTLFLWLTSYSKIIASRISYPLFSAKVLVKSSFRRKKIFKLVYHEQIQINYHGITLLQLLHLQIWISDLGTDLLPVRSSASIINLLTPLPHLHLLRLLSVLLLELGCLAQIRNHDRVTWSEAKMLKICSYQRGFWCFEFLLDHMD